MHRRQIARYHGKISLKMLSEWNILVLTDAYNELIDLQMKKNKGRVTTIFTVETDLKNTKNSKPKR